jgi:predicted lipoprotein with Yx(FWY)xxD motif
MNLKKNLPLAIAGIAVMFASWSCSKSNNNPTSNPDQPTPGNTVKLAATTKFGNVITDGQGKTLYFFAIDANGNSGCTGGCSTAWPTFYQANLTLDKGLDAKDFGTITRTDGAKQTTYKGWPLYYFAGDAKAGDINGDDSEEIWFVAKPDYTVMVANSQLLGVDGVNYTSDLKPGTGVTQYITDDRGQTLYSFFKDKFKVNNYTAADFSNNKTWPIDTVKAVQNIPSVLDKTQFDVITVFGKIQLVYKGWPLYYFGADNNVRGNNKGIASPKPGIWPYANKTTAAAPAN